jgi:hypothetical protein
LTYIKILMGLFKDCGCGCGGQKQQEKFIISVISGLTFFIIANPETFRLVRRVLGSWIATPTGCPSTLGLLVHTLVFTLVVWGMMNIKKGGDAKKGCGCGDAKKGCGCGDAKKKGIRKVAVSMVDAPEPKPGFAEPKIKLEDTGRILEPMSTSADGNLF